MTTTLASDLATHGWTALLAATFPFLLAVVLLLISPLLTKQVKTVVLNQIKESGRDHGVKEKKIPPGRGEHALGAYIDYAIDAVQIIPLTLLPVTGAVFAIAVHIPSEIALGYLSIAILVAVALESWVLSQLAGKFVARRLLKHYSVVVVTGIASNLLGLAMTLIYGVIYGP